MRYRKLGDSSLQVSEISMGCMSLGEDYSESAKILHKAFDEGINFFDTADLYQKGENEKIVGKALKDRRDQVIIATKVGNQWKPNGSGWEWNPTKSYILRAVDDSLRRLETEVIDLYQLHGGTVDDPIEETIEAFERLVEQGKIRYYGISSIRPNVIRTYVKKSNIVSIMSQYSLLDRRPEEETLNLLQKHGVGVLVRGALAKGLLAGKVAQAYLEYSAEEVLKVQNTLHSMEQEAYSSGQIAIQYVLSHPAVSTVVTGASSEQQIVLNARASDKDSLKEEDIKKLKNATKATVYEKHR